MSPIEHSRTVDLHEPLKRDADGERVMLKIRKSFFVEQLRGECLGDE
jgi:hypothetical protein